MADLFEDKAQGWDERPIPVQISTGVFSALEAQVALDEGQRVMDFGAGTGLICARIAPFVKEIVAVDISAAMLAKLAEKPELQGKCQTRCQDILEEPLGEHFDVIVSAMAMHHVEDTRALLHTLHAHLSPGGQLAIADLDREEGDFHPPGMEGVYHFGFEREALSELMQEAGFEPPSFETAVTLEKEEKRYTVFLVTTRKAA